VTALWTRPQLERVAETPSTTAPMIPWPAPRVLPGHDVWDPWPIQDAAGPPMVAAGRELWIALSAPAHGHPEARHDVARLRLLGRRGDAWDDLGPVFADAASPGSREWSGSAVRRPDGSVSIYYTAAGRRGEPRPTFLQRVIEARVNLLVDGAGIRTEGAGAHREIVRPHEPEYVPADEVQGSPGEIRAFRDPGWFRDPADGREHLLIAASVRWRERFMGAVAIARKDRGGWSLLPALLRADGITHEIERPHVVVHGGRYYLFFSADRRAFHPRDCAPTGLYGFVGSRLLGPYEPLNGSGLVIGNPRAQPDQAYAWLVLDDLRVVSFANYRSVDGDDPRAAAADTARARFGGTIAPMLRLALDGDTTSLAAAPTRPARPPRA
jgi:levansucrase